MAAGGRGTEGRASVRLSSGRLSAASVPPGAAARSATKVEMASACLVWVRGEFGWVGVW